MEILSLEQLLYEQESTSLDFKRDQYPFQGADDVKKSELLKDILAFANSWRREDAYILIGVQEVESGKSIVKGVSDHLDEASLQQFVNKKTHKPLEFSYTTNLIEGKEVGVIKIPVQSRPFYIVKDFGKVRKETVYIRRGSSTDIAKPDEIASMGYTTAESVQPKLALEFADPHKRTRIGTSIKLISEIVKYEAHRIPFYGNTDPIVRMSSMDNNQYFRDLARFISEKAKFQPVYFNLQNLGSILTPNVRVRISAENQADLLVVDKNSLLSAPSKMNIPGVTNFKIRGGAFSVNIFETSWTFEGSFGHIQPKDSILIMKLFTSELINPIR